MRTLTMLTLAFLLTSCSASVQPLEAPAEQAAQQMLGSLTASDYVAHLDVLALGFADGTFEVRSPAPRHVLGRGRHEAEIVNVALTKDATKLATVDAKGRVAVSVVESGALEELGTLLLEQGGLVGLAWDRSGRRLAVSAGTLVRVFDVEQGHSWDTHLDKPVAALAFSPDDSQLVAAGESLLFLRLKDLSVASSHPLIDASHVATDLRFSPDGKLLGILMLGRVGFFHVPTGRAEVAEVRLLNPVGLRFASDGHVVIFGRHALYEGAPIANQVAQGAKPSRGELWDVEFREDDSLLFVGSNPDAELGL